MLARGRVIECVMKRFADSMGRYTYMTLNGKYCSGVIIITIYRVYQTKTGVKTGPDTAYPQQYVALQETGDTAPDPREKILDDITTLIGKWLLQGLHPIVMGDFNSDINEREK